MNSQDYRNLQEAYLQVYSSPTLNEFGPVDGGSFTVGTTYGGAPGTKQKTTVSGSASSGGSNVSGSLTKGTSSGQGDKTSQGIDNAINNYQNQEKPDPKYQNKDTSTSTITKGISGTFNANVSGGVGPGNKNQENLAKSQQKAAMLRTAATNIQNQQKAKAAANAAASSTSTALKSTPDDGKSAAQQETDKANSEKEARNSKYLKDRSDLVSAGVTDEAGNETLNGRRDLENRLGGKDGATSGELLDKLRNVTGNNDAVRRRNSTGVRNIVHKGGGVYGAESFDLFDYMMEYLIDEGYANTNESALVIMANMSEGWRENILTEFLQK